MNSFQKFGSALTLSAALTACSKPDQVGVEKESTSHVVTTQVQNNISDKLSHSESKVKLPKTIEIAGHTILAMPLESMKFTPEQEKRFVEEGGLINPASLSEGKITKDTKLRFVSDLTEMTSSIDGRTYSGFELWKKIYQ